MVRLKVGDRVNIKPVETSTPWKGKLTGTVILVPDDGTIGVDVDNGNNIGHGCITKGYRGKTENGWWFMPHELKLVEELNKMAEYKLLSRGRADELVYYLKNQAMHEATMHKIQITTTVRQDKDEDNIPYEELIIRVPFTNREG